MSERSPYIPSIRDKLAAVLSGQLLGFEIVSHTSSTLYPQYAFTEPGTELSPCTETVYYDLSRSEAQLRLQNQEYDDQA